MTKPILLIPSGVMSPKEKKDIEDAGYLTIVTDQPEKIKFITPNEETLMGLTKDKVFAAMMRVLYNGEGTAHDYNR